MLKAWLLVVVALALFPRAAWSQGMPVGPEFLVNTYTTSFQKTRSMASVASDGSGDFVVVWESYLQDGSGQGVFGQRYASSGVPLGPEFRANTFGTGDQVRPTASLDPSGNFVVVWEGDSQDGAGFGVFGQRYASSGAPLGSEFRVNTFTTGDQRYPSVAADSSGGFVVVWSSLGQDGASFGVFGQRYANTGAPLGPEFRVNTYTTDSQSHAAVAAPDASGDFVVVWRSFLQDGAGYGVFGQRYAGSGAPLGPEFRVNTYTTSAQGSAAVAPDAAGNFVVVWSSYTQDGSVSGVYGQRYASSGAPLGPEFRVNTNTTNSQYGVSVAGDTSGNFVVTWMSVQDGSAYGVYGQRYASSGAPLGSEFRVNTFTTDLQGYSSVAADSAGNFVVVWQSYGQDGSSYGVYAQRYGQIVPIELMRFGVE